MPVAPFAWTYEKNRVDFDGETLTIGDTSYALGHVEPLARGVSRSAAQGSWNRIECWVHVFGSGQEASVKFHGDAAVEGWGPWRLMWDQVDSLVHEEIMPRILERTVSRVLAGDTVEIGSAGGKGRGRFTVTTDALQARSWLSKPIPWKAIVTMSDDAQQVVVDVNGKQRKQSIALAPFEYDAWLIRLLWGYFGRQ